MRPLVSLSLACLLVCAWASLHTVASAMDAGTVLGSWGTVPVQGGLTPCADPLSIHYISPAQADAEGPGHWVVLCSGRVVVVEMVSDVPTVTRSISSTVTPSLSFLSPDKRLFWTTKGATFSGSSGRIYHCSVATPGALSSSAVRYVQSSASGANAGNVDSMAVDTVRGILYYFNPLGPPLLPLFADRKQDGMVRFALPANWASSSVSVSSYAWTSSPPCSNAVALPRTTSSADSSRLYFVCPNTNLVSVHTPTSTYTIHPGFFVSTPLSIGVSGDLMTAATQLGSDSLGLTYEEADTSVKNFLLTSGRSFTDTFVHYVDSDDLSQYTTWWFHDETGVVRQGSATGVPFTLDACLGPGGACTATTAPQMGGVWRAASGDAQGMLLRKQGSDLAATTFVAASCAQHTSCSSCRSSDVNYCGWCVQTASCTMVDGCPVRSSWLNEVWNGALVCPSLSALAPNSLNKLGGGPPMSVIGSHLRASVPPLVGGALECHWDWGAFGSAQETAVLTGDSNTVQCSARAHPAAPDTADQDWPKVGVLSLLYQGLPYADAGLNITYTNCPNTCGECTTVPGCGWCSGLSVCTSEPLCVGDTQQPWLENTCPSLVDATPNAGEITSGRQLVRVSMSTAAPLGDTPNWACQWHLPSGAQQLTPAQRTGVAEVECRSPEAQDAMAGEGYVTLRYNGIAYAPSDPLGARFNFYNCSSAAAASSCDACITQETPDCHYCIVERTCRPPQPFSASGDASPVCGVGGSANSVCPELLQVQPPEGGRFGTTVVTVFVSQVPQDDSLAWACAFAFDSPDVNDTTVSAVATSSTTIQCTPPPVSREIASNLTVLLNGEPLAHNALSYSFLACDSITSCSSCVLTPECRFCASQTCQEATANSTCPAQDVHTSCPALASVSPSKVARGASAALTLRVNYFPTLPDNAFEVVILANATVEVERSTCTLASSTSVTCDPVGSALPTGFYGVQLLLTNLADPVWAESANALQVHDCQEQSNCTQCMSSVSGCAWCLTSARCDASSSSCAPGDDYTLSGCPSVTALQPTHGDDVGGTVITAVGELLTSGLSCRFQRDDVTQYAPATKVSDTAVTCVSPQVIVPPPSTRSRRRVSAFPVSERVDLVYSDTQQAYADTPGIGFDYIQCDMGSTGNASIATDSCVTCVSSALVDPRCGWCASALSCSSRGNCGGGGAEVWDDSLLSCPFITSFEPDVGPAAGGTLVNVTGTNFVNVSDVACEFDGVPSNATAFAHAGGVGYRCPTPPVNASLAESARALVRLVVLKGNGTSTPFTAPAQGSFLYVVDSKEDSASGLGLGALLGMAGGALLLLALLAVLILLAVRRRRGGRRVLRKPDYSLLLFPRGTGGDYHTSNRQRQRFAVLRRHLLQPDMAFVDLMISQKTGANASALGLGFAYVFNADRRTMHLLRHLITTEVAIAKAPGTLFRANSIATKCFTAWSRLNLLDYSWHVLARMVNDIADRNRRREGAVVAEATDEAESVMMADFEIGPTMTEADQQDVIANSYQVLIVLTKLFARLKRSIPHMPMDLRRFLRHVKTEVSTRWPDERYKGVGGFLILRFLNPALISPHHYGLLESAPSAGTRNNLLTISRVFQNLINETLPGAKQEYLTKFNEFVDDNLFEWHAFVDELTAIAGGDEDWDVRDQQLEASVDVPEAHFVDAQVELHNVVARGQDDMARRADRVWEYMQEPLRPIEKE